MSALLDAIADVRIHAFLKTRFLASSRYDILPFMPLNVAAAKLLGKTLHGLSRDTGAAQGLFDAKGVYRSLVESRSLADLESRLPRFGSLYYDFGTFTGRLVAPGHVVVRRTGLPRFIHDWYAPMQAAYVEAIVRELGASFVEVTPRPPEPSLRRGPFELCVLDSDVKWRT